MKSDPSAKKVTLRMAIWILCDHGYAHTGVVSLGGLEEVGFSESQANDIRSRKEFKKPNSDVYIFQTPEGSLRAFSVSEMKKTAETLVASDNN